jgi:dihydrolipoamide dehydrogenase
MVVGDFTQKVETVIVGAGPGGYVAAIRAAQLAQEVVLIEKELLGGVCLNWGCIPSKAMIEVSGLKKHVEKAMEMGLIVKDIAIDLNQLHKWKNGIVEKLRTGVGSLLLKNGIDVIQGTTSFTEPGKILVASEHGIQRFEFKNLILATGSSPIPLPGIPFDHELIIDSTDALGLEKVPEKMVVVGAGSIGIELGLVYAKLGSEVTIVEFQDKFLPFLDPELPRILEKSLKKNNVKLMIDTKIEKVNPKNDKAEIIYSQAGKPTTVEAERVLVAIGRRPNTEDIGLDKIGLQVDQKGFIEVNKKMQT